MRRRKYENCEKVVEDFLKENPRFAGVAGWFYSWCRESNGGDPPYHEGPFKEDQLYISFSELVTVYPPAGLELMMTDEVKVEDMYFPVICGALLAFKKSDAEDPGWLYYDKKWVRLGEGSSSK